MGVAQRLYARALFEAARDEGRLEQVSADLAAVAAAVDEVSELGAFLRNPEVDPAGKAGVLEEISRGADELARNFLRLTALKGRAGEIVEMSAELEASTETPGNTAPVSSRTVPVSVAWANTEHGKSSAVTRTR